jgi:phage terminase Nu1 subunit (DNA packaging protein)
MKIKTSIADAPISTEDAARLIGRSSRWVNLLFQKGYIKKNGDGLYTAAAVVEGFVKNLMEEKRATGHSAAVTELAATKARIAALKEATLRNELVPFGELLEFYAQSTSTLLSKLEGLPAAFTRDIKERRRLQKMIEGIRNEFAKWLRAQAAKLPEGESK